MTDQQASPGAAASDTSAPADASQNSPDESASSIPAPSKKRYRLLRRTVLACVVLVAAGFGSFKAWQAVAVSDDAPVIGVSYDTAWHARWRISTKNYEVALTKVGARIQELDPQHGDPNQILDEIDALLLTGGGDIDPRLYGGNPHDGQLVDRIRDDFEIALIRGALERGMPILGICRGIQILNVVQGGTLTTLRDDPERSKRHGIGLSSMSAHNVTIAKDSKLAELLKPGDLAVNSFHGQAVGKVGGRLKVAATAEDGVIEAIECPDRAFVVTMQWHPEVPPQQMPVFEAFCKQAKSYRSRRSR